MVNECSGDDISKNYIGHFSDVKSDVLLRVRPDPNLSCTIPSRLRIDCEIHTERFCDVWVHRFRF